MVAPLYQPDPLPDLSNLRWLVPSSAQEFYRDHEKGSALIQQAGHILGVFGTAREGRLSPSIKEALTDLVREFTGPEMGHSVLTGGGTETMQIALRAAASPDRAMSIRAGLLKEEYVADLPGTTIDAENLLFTRRFFLTTAPTVILSTPGGLGTLNEFKETVMLNACGAISTKSIILLDDERQFWRPLKELLLDKVATSLAERGYLDRLLKIVNTSSKDEVRTIFEYARSQFIDNADPPPNREWFTEHTRKQVSADLEAALRTFDLTARQDLLMRTPVSLHAGSRLTREVGDLDALLLPDREMFLASRLEAAQYIHERDVPGVTVFSRFEDPGLAATWRNFEGINHSIHPIGSLLCAPRFVTTTAGAKQLFVGNDWGSIVPFSESIMLRQLGVTIGRPLLCIDTSGFWSRYRTFLTEKVLDGGYISPADMDLFKVYGSQVLSSTPRDILKLWDN